MTDAATDQGPVVGGLSESGVPFMGKPTFAGVLSDETWDEMLEAGRTGEVTTETPRLVAKSI